MPTNNSDESNDSNSNISRDSSNSRNNDNGNCNFKRFTSFFTKTEYNNDKSHTTVTLSSLSNQSPSKNFNENNGKIQNQISDNSESNNQSTNDSLKNLYKNGLMTKKDDDTGKTAHSFLLPRAMLKYQSVISMDSVPSTADTSANNSICKLVKNSATLQNECRINNSSYSNANSNEDQQQYHHQHQQQQQQKQEQQQNAINDVVRNSDLVQFYGKSEHHRDSGSGHATILNSHYSTEKSGSSGYYSSNLCSTSSVEEHIYSEPVVVDGTAGNSCIIEKIRAPQLVSSQSLKNGLVKPDNDDGDDDDDGGESCYNAEDTAENINKNLRILETSIENLSRHLRNCSLPICNDKINSTSISLYDYKQDKYRQLPTIMEGNDNQSIVTKAQNSWSEDLDDSLIDIDLDSFLVGKNKMNRKSKDGKRNNLLEGNDNLAFNEIDNDDMENNYKCSKYVNSCPENAYQLESIFNDEAITKNDDSNAIDNGKDKTQYFVKNFENRTNLANAKEMLEDINNMLRALSEKPCKFNDRNNILKDLDQNICVLRNEFESYLRLINHNNELEMKQLSSGLINNQKLVAITNAFERRKSLGISGYSTASGSCNGIITFQKMPSSSSSSAQLVYENDGDNLSENNSSSIRCSTSDPNFKLKRKPLSEIFPLTKSECYKSNSDISSSISIENNDYEVPNDNKIFNHNNLLQLQRNLSLQNTRRQRQRKLKINEEQDSILEWHRDKPSFWELYYGSNRLNQSLYGKKGQLVKAPASPLSYPSSRPESDFTLDVPRAEQLRLKLEGEKKFRQRCRLIMTFFSFIFFLLTVMIVSLILTRGKRMFGSMI